MHLEQCLLYTFYGKHLFYIFIARYPPKKHSLIYMSLIPFYQHKKCYLKIVVIEKIMIFYTLPYSSVFNYLIQQR